MCWQNRPKLSRPLADGFHGFLGLTFWFTMAGIATAWYCYIKNPAIPAQMAQRFSTLRYVLVKRYGFDAFNELVFVRGTQKLSDFFYYFADAKVIDSWLVNGSGRGVQHVAAGTSTAIRLSLSLCLRHDYWHCCIIAVVSILCVKVIKNVNKFTLTEFANLASRCFGSSGLILRKNRI